MKTRPLLWILPLVAFGCAHVWAQQTVIRKYGAEMSVDADVRADFYKRYPDLRDESDIVNAAARALDAEGVETRDLAAAADLLAKRTRALLARRTPQEWQRKAVSLFPDLGVQGTSFNTLFLRRYNELKQKSPEALEEPSWPVLLARRCADELQPKPPVSTAKSSLKAEPVSADPAAPPAAQTAPRSRWWLSVLNLCLLLAIIVQPARWLWRCRRAFAGSDVPVTLWQRALGPATWTYLLAALIALARTFTANADQSFFDRFGITLLVSFAAGVVFAVPAYGVALASFWWWRQRTPATPKGPEGNLQDSPAIPAGGRKA